jgi:2-amino-4-hydroxy-6-hydroxymethyldihydropteridine diphosphokinase
VSVSCLGLQSIYVLSSKRASAPLSGLILKRLFMRNSHLSMKNKKLLLCLGSNFDQEKNTEKARKLLCNTFKSITFSKNLWTTPIGKGTSLYLNCLASTETTMDYDELNVLLKRAELSFGRTPEEKKQNIVRIDIDVLQYGDKILHPDDWERYYVKQLLQQLK